MILELLILLIGDYITDIIYKMPKCYVSCYEIHIQYVGICNYFKKRIPYIIISFMYKYDKAKMFIFTKCHNVLSAIFMSIKLLGHFIIYLNITNKVSFHARKNNYINYLINKR